MWNEKGNQLYCRSAGKLINYLKRIKFTFGKFNINYVPE